MTWFEYHCEKCRADNEPYIRAGDTIRFWSRAHEQHVEGKVVSIAAYENPWPSNKAYTIAHNGERVTVHHGPDNPVFLIARPGLPVTYDEHLAYFNKHQRVSPNIPFDFHKRIRAMRKKASAS